MWSNRLYLFDKCNLPTLAGVSPGKWAVALWQMPILILGKKTLPFEGRNAPGSLRDG